MTNRTYVQIDDTYRGKKFSNVWLQHSVGDVTLEEAMYCGGIYDRMTAKYGPIRLNEYGSWHSDKKRHTFCWIHRSPFDKDDILIFPKPFIRKKRESKYRKFLLRKEEDRAFSEVSAKLHELMDSMEKIFEIDLSEQKSKLPHLGEPLTEKNEVTLVLKQCP